MDSTTVGRETKSSLAFEMYIFSHLFENLPVVDFAWTNNSAFIYLFIYLVIYLFVSCEESWCIKPEASCSLVKSRKLKEPRRKAKAKGNLGWLISPLVVTKSDIFDFLEENVGWFRNLIFDLEFLNEFPLVFLQVSFSICLLLLLLFYNFF